MSTPHCSLVLYLDQDTSALPHFLRDVGSFFQKFPLSYEVVVCLECGTDLPLTPPAEVRFVTSTYRRGRAASLWRGLCEAQGAFRMSTTADMNTPLGDLFKLLQHSISETDMDIVWGNRYTKKGSPFLKTAHKREQTEDLFNRILKEKFSPIPGDPLSEAVVLKADIVSRIAKQSSNRKPEGWYLAPFLLRVALELQLRPLEVPIYDSGKTSSQFSIWRARWSLLKQCVL